MLNFLGRWPTKKPKAELTIGYYPAEVEGLIIDLLDETIEEMQETIEELRLRDVANKTIIRSQKRQLRELNADNLKNLELRSSNLLLKVALRDLVTYSERVVQEANYHKSRNVISGSMQESVRILEKVLSRQASEALDFVDKLDE